MALPWGGRWHCRGVGDGTAVGWAMALPSPTRCLNALPGIRGIQTVVVYTPSTTWYVGS